MGSELDPTALTRLRQALQPDWVHTVRARRLAAAGLVLLAGVAVVRDNPDADLTTVVIAARDLTPGTPVSADDLHVESRSAATLPDGAQVETATVLGATVAGPVRRGEVLTDVRLLGSRLAESATGPDARIVPLHLADNAVLDVIRSGDVVDILAAPHAESDSVPKVIATDAIVVLVSAAPQGPGQTRDRVVLVALPSGPANTVAGAALVQSLTLTLH
ncbi:SAF domain-containing protein [Mycobacterium sp. ACS4331]|uniref:SAF domain-containing protein n=1 Tax=Mycobacterium sp. ACS4331 TaxID=1834121 RepID=UPI0007FBB6F1|nr:SAF domain-containing protein [Mycobacterium sp. ACS4331]OBF19740.1 flagellar biosynthesis protein FlgA [Mycobacterium sp. ACS4331]